MGNPLNFGPVTQAMLPDARVGTLFLLRHGELERHERRLLRGQAEASLSPRGLAQQAALWRLFAEPGRRPNRIFSSDLGRCRSLADGLAASGVEPVFDPRLREQSLGKFEGRDWEELSREHPEAVRAYWADYAHTRPPGGESLVDVGERVGAFLDQHLESWLGQRILVITHAGVLRCLLCRALELPLSQALRLAPATGSYSTLSHSSAGFVLENFSVLPPESTT